MAQISCPPVGWLIAHDHFCGSVESTPHHHDHHDHQPPPFVAWPFLTVIATKGDRVEYVE